MSDEILLRRLTPENRFEIDELTDAMLSRPASVDAGIADRDALRSYLEWHTTDPKRRGIWQGLRNGDLVGWMRANPIEHGREALCHFVGRPGVAWDALLREDSVRTVVRYFFERYEVRRVTMPVIDLDRFPLLAMARDAFEAAGARHEGCLRHAAFTRARPEPYDLHLFGALREESHGRI